VTRYASLAAKLLRRSHGQTIGALPGRDPASLVPVARRALAQRRQRLVLRKVALGTVALSAAAALALAVGPWRRSASPPATLASRSPSHPFSILGTAQVGGGPAASSRSALGTGISLQAPDSAPVRIGSADGTILTLEARGELSVVDQSATRRFALRHGAVRAQVAHLHDGERFLIATDDAEVEVHGTVFRVALADGDPGCEEGRRTRVSVTEGVVSVRAGGRETLVAAGDSWPACARPATAPVADVSPAAAPPAHPLAVSGAAGRRPLPALQTPQASARQTAGLSLANDLFAAAVRAKREHRTDEAVRLFARLIEVAPDGPLAEGATAQKMKLLAATDPQAGRRAAADYLARYPDGFARADARRLAGNGP